MTDTIIETVNKEVLKSFKTLQKNKSILYTTATDEHLISINDKSIIIYDNPQEIDFEGTFKLTRNKLIPVEHELETDVESLIDLSKFTKLKSFNWDLTKLQKYCYDEKLRINIPEINETVSKLLEVYRSFTLYKNIERDEVLFLFGNAKHKCFLISKLI